MLVNALHPTLEDRVEALDRVGVYVATDILTRRMGRKTVFREYVIELPVVRRLIGHHPAFGGDVGLKDGR